MKRRSTSDRAFTLIELLVVIAIIALLIAILLPTLIRAKQSAQQAACAANLYQIGHAMTMYTQKDGYFPAAMIQNGSSAWTDAHCWPVRLRKFLGGNQKVFFCPAQDPRCQWTQDMGGEIAFADEYFSSFGYEIGERLLVGGPSPTSSNPRSNGTYFSYGFNNGGVWPLSDLKSRSVCVSGPSYDLKGNRTFYTLDTKVTRVKSPSEFILVADTVADGWEDFWVGPKVVVGPASLSVGTIHRGGANVLFCDGHVEWNLQTNISLLKWPAAQEEAGKQRLWNADHLAYDRSW